MKFSLLTPPVTTIVLVAAESSGLVGEMAG